MVDIALGQYLLSFGLVIAVTFFILGFLISKFAFHGSIVKSCVIGAIAAAIGFFASPAILMVTLHLRGISF